MLKPLMLLPKKEDVVRDQAVVYASRKVAPWVPFEVKGLWYFHTFENNIYKCTMRDL